MPRTVGDFLVQRLHAWGVCLLFGYPGDGMFGARKGGFKSLTACPGHSAKDFRIACPCAPAEWMRPLVTVR
jgi:hypothetical protein